MKFGFRKPSLRKSLAARTSVRRYVRQSLGLRAPRGWGWLTHPRKAAYNRVYRRTTIGWQDLLPRRRRRRATRGCLVIVAFALGAALVLALAATGVTGFAGLVTSIIR